MIQAGYFGKTIHRGDFVRFNLPKVFINVIDDWLTAVMIHAESVHAGDWEKNYIRCPGYRFELSPHIAGEHRWMGVMVPGHDKVGRRFPFCIAASFPDTQPPPAIHRVVMDCMTQFEKLIELTQAPGHDFETLQTQVVAVAKSISDAFDEQPAAEYNAVDQNDPEQFLLLTKGDSPNAVPASIADLVLRQAYGQYSIWTPLGIHGDYQGLISSGLPDRDTAVALFDNLWPLDRISTLNSYRKQSLSEDHRGEDDIRCEQAIVDAQKASGRVVAAEPQHASPQASAVTEDEQAAPLHLSTASVENKSAVLTDDQSTTIPRPRIEPLELDEDSSTDAPWD